MTNAINNTEKKAQLELVVIGRLGKIRICRMRPDVYRSKASNAEKNVPEKMTLRQAIMHTIAEELDMATAGFEKHGKKVNIEIYTVGQVSIKYYQMVKFLKGKHFPTAEDIASLSVKNDGTRNNDTAEDVAAYTALAEAIANCIAKGNGVHLQASGNADVFELIVPEGVTVTEGQKLDFVDGVSAEGVRVRGWNKANRMGAEVIVKGTKAPRAYISKAADPKKPWNSLATLLETINGIWESLPVADKDKSRDDGSMEDLYSA
jgi:hypothetical protein